MYMDVTLSKFTWSLLCPRFYVTFSFIHNSQFVCPQFIGSDNIIYTMYVDVYKRYIVKIVRPQLSVQKNYVSVDKRYIVKFVVHNSCICLSINIHVSISTKIFFSFSLRVKMSKKYVDPTKKCLESRKCLLL